MMGHRNFRAMKKLLEMDVPDILQALTEDPSILTYFSVLLSEAERTTDAQPAAGPWRTDQPPMDGRSILAVFSGQASVVFWWETGWSWYLQHNVTRMSTSPSAWAEIIMPAAQAEEGEAKKAFEKLKEMEGDG